MVTVLRSSRNRANHNIVVEAMGPWRRKKEPSSVYNNVVFNEKFKQKEYATTLQSFLKKSCSIFGLRKKGSLNQMS